MMPSATSGNFRPSRRFACDRCRSFKLRCQRDEALGEACERCAKTKLPCTTTFEHTTQRQPLANLNHVHHQNLDVTEQEGQNGENLSAAVIEAHPLPPENRNRNTQRRGDGHSRFNTNPGQPPRHSSSPPPGGHDESPNRVVWNPLPSPSVETRLRPPPSTSKQQLTTSETNRSARHWPDSGERMLIDHNSLGLDGMDFAMPDFPFDSGDYDFSRLMDGHHPAPSSEIEVRVAVGGRHRRDGSEGVSGIFGHRDDDVGLNGAATDLVNRPALSHQGGWGGNGSLSSTADTGRNHDAVYPPSTSGADSLHHVSQQLNSYIGLLKLSLELAEDQNILETQAPLDAMPKPSQHQCPPAEQSRFINRVLNQSARFWEILKNMSAEVESQRQCAGSGSHSNGGCSNGFNDGNDRRNAHDLGFDSGVWLGSTRDMPGDTGSNRVDMGLFGMTASSSPSATAAVSVMSQRVDHMMVVNLVMTYVYLLRSCRAVFARLYQALETAPRAESRSPLKLPSMQFGDFQLDNNLAVQVKVLVEMISGMLLRISSTLGISPAGVILPTNGNTSPRVENHDSRLPFMSDPLAVSVRELILSQEKVHSSVAQAGEAPPLREVLSNLRRLLERRYCV